MSYKKVKTAGKMFNADPVFLRNKTMSTMKKVSNIVGSSYGPGGRNTIIESELPNIPNKNTKDGVTIFENLGSDDSFEHLIIEQARDAASRTASEAGDGTTATTIISEAMIRHLFNFCMVHPKYSPQKAMREINKAVKEFVVPLIQKHSVHIDEDNMDLLRQVATISANGDTEMANAVMEAFDKVGYSDQSHVTIQELSGPSKFEVEHVTGYPIPMGYEESCGKFWQTFITDKGNNTVLLDNPKFLLFDGAVTDLTRFYRIIDYFGSRYAAGDTDFKNMVLIAHGFSENVLLELSFNMADGKSLNIVPMRTPMNQILNSQTEFLHDIAAFAGAKVMGMEFNIQEIFERMDKGEETAELELMKCFGTSTMDKIEIQRFRATLVGQPEDMNVEVRSDDLKKRIKGAANAKEKEILEERIGMLTSGIAKLKVFGPSNGELKEKHDRCEDAVCAVRAAVKYGVLPGGCREWVNIVKALTDTYGTVDVEYDVIVQAISNGTLTEEQRVQRIDLKPNVVAGVLVASFMEPLYRLLENVGLHNEEIDSIFTQMYSDESVIYDAENHVTGKYQDMGIYDATKAIEEAVKNATSIATVLGTLGGIIAFPRDHELERAESKDMREYRQMIENPHAYVNEADNRF